MHAYRSHTCADLNTTHQGQTIRLSGWVHRVRDHGGQPAAFERPAFAIASASPGGLGGYRGLMALRQTLVLQLGAVVVPQMVSVSKAHEAFDDDGSLKDERSAGFLRTLSAKLVKLAQGVEVFTD